MTRIRRMTITLPPRLRYQAEQEARRIAEATAKQISQGAPSRLSVTVDGGGASGHGLASTVGRITAARTKGRL